MPHAIRSKLLVAAGVLLVLMGAVAWVVYHNAARAAESADGADHIRQVVGVSDALMADLAEAESGRCGYLVKRDPAPRGRCDQALGALAGDVDNLRRLVGDDGEQGRHIDVVEQQVARVADLIRASFEMRDDVRRRLDDKGQAAMTREVEEAETGVRDALADVKTRESERLARSQEAGRSAAGQAMTAVDVGNVLALLTAAFAVVVLRRDFVAWDRSDAASREARGQAERRAEEADAALKAQAVRQEQIGEQCRRLEQLGAVGRLTGGVAHDFNNLLTVMMGGCEATLRVLPPDASLREPLGAALKACEKASALSRRLLALSRNRPPQPTPLDLNAVVTDMDGMLRRLVGDGVVLETALDPTLRPVVADPVRVEQVLLNLVVNARDAAAGNGRVRVSTRNVGAEVELAVTDDGCGMDEATQARMFEPFFTTKGEGKGTGLGLSIVLEAVRESGGRIEVDSAPRRGACIRVCLPAAAAGPAPATVLLVDPGDKAAPIVLETLRGFGHTVLRARDGEEALRAAEAHAGPIHLLVTDMAPPGMCGPELARRLAEARPGMKVLYLTADSFLPQIRMDSGRQGPGVLPRPYTLEIVGRALREALGASVGR